MEASDGDNQPRDASPRAVRADHAGERLDGDVGDAEQDPGGGAEHHTVVMGGAPIRGPMISSVPITIRPASKPIIPGPRSASARRAQRA